MGGGIVLLLWIIVFAIVSGILGWICFFIAYLIVRKKPYKNKTSLYLLSLFTPFILLFSELFIGLIGTCFVTDKVDMGFGDYWQAPLNEKYCLSAIDDPDRAYVDTYDEGLCVGCGRVKCLWQAPDTITILCDDSSLYAFPVHAETFDTLCGQEQITSILKERNLSEDNAMTPDAYFIKTQREAHRIEAPIRHSLVILLLAGLWWRVIRRIKNEAES